MLKRFAVIAFVLVLVQGLAACGGAPTGHSTGNTEKLQVVVSFDAMGEFVKAVGGDKVMVTVMVPAGTEPHEFEPKAKDLAVLGSAKLFVYNGLGMESWAEKAVAAVSNKALVTVDAAAGSDALSAGESGETAGQADPHLWLSLKGAEHEAATIKNGLVKADPADQAYFEENYKTFLDALERLYNDYAEKFKQTPTKDFVTGHAAFAYLCRDFGLTQRSVEDVFASGEPTAQKLTELIDFCKTNKVKTIFTESTVSPAVAKTLAGEAGAQVKILYTLENAEDGLDYLSRMKDNLQEIYENLRS